MLSVNSRQWHHTTQQPKKPATTCLDLYTCFWQSPFTCWCSCSKLSVLFCLWWWGCHYGSREAIIWHDHLDIDGIVQDFSKSSVLALELLQSCTKPSTYAQYTCFWQSSFTCWCSCSKLSVLFCLWWWGCHYGSREAIIWHDHLDIDDIVQDFSKSSVLALELLQSCTKPSTYAQYTCFWQSPFTCWCSCSKLSVLFCLWWWGCHYGSREAIIWHDHLDIDGIVQDFSNSSVLALELLQSCTKPSTYAQYTCFWQSSFTCWCSCSKLSVLFCLWWWGCHYGSREAIIWHDHLDIDGIVQDFSNSSVLALELLQSCTKPSTYAQYTCFWQSSFTCWCSCSKLSVLFCLWWWGCHYGSRETSIWHDHLDIFLPTHRTRGLVSI